MKGGFASWSTDMLQLQLADRDRWTIVDEQNQLRFAGTLHECEDWLDFQDNVRQCSAVRGSWWQTLRQAIGRFAASHLQQRPLHRKVSR